MARTANPEPKSTYFVLKVTNVNHRVSTLVGELYDPDTYSHSFRNAGLLCEAVRPSDITNIQCYLDIACSRQPIITPKELEKWVDAQNPYNPDKSMKQNEKERGPPPINESISGVNPDKIWIIYRRHINGKEALYG